MTYTREQIARAALEAGVPAEKIREILKFLGDTTALHSYECAGRNTQAEAAGSQRYEAAWSGTWPPDFFHRGVGY